MTEPRRPALRYHGGKWKQARTIIAEFPPHRVYVEPFGGGASVLLRKPRSYAEVYNDLDGEIVSFFRILRDPDTAAELQRRVAMTPFARGEFNEAYQAADDPIEEARRLLIRSFMGFGSDGILAVSRTGFRANSNRSGTTPAQDWRNFADCIPEFTERLRGVVIENRHAREVIAAHDGPETLFYVDPPYVLSTRKGWGLGLSRGYKHELGDEDHAHLAAILNGVRGMVVLSGYACDLYEQLYDGWKRIEYGAHADGARARVETVWINDAASRSHGLFAGVAS